MSISTHECLASANELLAAHSALLSRVRTTQLVQRRQLKTLRSPPQEILNLPLIPSPQHSPTPSPPSSPLLQHKPKPHRPDLPPAKRARVARYNNYVPEEETIRNDYSQRYVDGGEWPQNWVLGADPEHRFEEYPKQQRLLALKKESVAASAIPPTFLSYSQLSTLHPAKFDVILIDPPFSSSFGWDELHELPIPSLAADPSFVLMWVGSGAGEGLERGREVMAKWGFRRCEDIVWVKTNNTTNRGPGTDPPTTSLLTRTKQHCLMGIRGTVRRSTDSWFVHCNVDTDVMIWEGDLSDPTLKPPEMYTLVENFCLGTRRLEIFGRAQSVRRGWVTALAEGEEERISEGMVLGDGDVRDGAMAWERERWESQIKELANSGKAVVPMTPEIDALRPKSPVRGGSANANQSNMPPPNGPGISQMGMNMPMSMNMAGGTPNNMNRNVNGFNNPPRMMGGPMMQMGNMPGGTTEMSGMGMMPWTDMGMNAVNMGAMSNMANVNVPMGGMQMGGVTGMDALGMSMAQHAPPMRFSSGNAGFGVGIPGVGGFDGAQMQGVPSRAMGMGWMGPGGEGQFVDPAGGGMWDGMGVGENMMGMNGMGGMGMGVNMSMGSGLAPGMGMGMNMGQWNPEGFEGGFRG